MMGVGLGQKNGKKQTILITFICHTAITGIMDASHLSTGNSISEHADAFLCVRVVMHMRDQH